MNVTDTLSSAWHDYGLSDQDLTELRNATGLCESILKERRNRVASPL